jgi:hypothetical protein
MAGQWDALGAAAGSGGQFMHAFMAAKQQAMQNQRLQSRRRNRSRSWPRLI